MIIRYCIIFFRHVLMVILMTLRVMWVILTSILFFLIGLGVGTIGPLMLYVGIDVQVAQVRNLAFVEMGVVMVAAVVLPMIGERGDYRPILVSLAMGIGLLAGGAWLAHLYFFI